MASRYGARRPRKTPVGSTSGTSKADLKAFFTSPSTTSTTAESPIPRSPPAPSPPSTIASDDERLVFAPAVDEKPRSTSFGGADDAATKRINDPARESDPPAAQSIDLVDIELDHCFDSMDHDQFTSGNSKEQAEAAKHLDDAIGNIIATNKEQLGKTTSVCEELTGLTARESKMMRDLDTAIQGGRLDPRSSLGQKFAEEHKPGKEGHDEWKNLKTYHEKERFRLDWASKKYTEIRESKSWTKSFNMISEESGTYMPPRRIFQEDRPKPIWGMCWSVASDSPP